MTAVLFACMGVVAGVAQAALLARGARNGAHALSFLTRLLLVAVVLLAAALAGHLILGALGWMAGFGFGVVAIARRYR